MTWIPLQLLGKLEEITKYILNIIIIDTIIDAIIETIIDITIDSFIYTII